MKLKNSGQSEDQLDAGRGGHAAQRLSRSGYADAVRHALRPDDDGGSAAALLYVRAQGRAFVPADGNNLVLKAAAALQAATGCTRGARITLKIHPRRAGMGGGSSDAAAALVG